MNLSTLVPRSGLALSRRLQLGAHIVGDVRVGVRDQAAQLHVLERYELASRGSRTTPLEMWGDDQIDHGPVIDTAPPRLELS
jgi:hypothetical protein